MSVPRFLMHRWCLTLALAMGALLSPAGAASPQASLVFARTEVAETAKPSQTEMTVRFPFQNRGTKVVRILEIKSDCSCCTTGDPSKGAYGPGEQGEIAITFKFGAFTGVQRKGVVVKTDDPAQPLIPLAIIATLPEILTLQKNVLLWEEGEPAEPKTIIVTTHAAAFVKELHAVTDSRFLKTSVAKIRPGEYCVSVTPTGSRRNFSATLQIEAIREDAPGKHLNAFVRVR